MQAPNTKPAVLHILEAMGGGTYRHVRDLLPRLSARGYAVTLAASFRRNPPLRDTLAPLFAESGIPIHELPMLRAISPLSDTLNAIRLTRLIRTLRPSLIHTHSSKAGFLGRLAGTRLGIPVIHSPHAFHFLMRGNRCTKSFYRLLERLIQPKTAALVAVSQEEVRAAREIGFPPGRIRHIPNGTCQPPTPPPEDPPRQTVGFFGRLSRQKGADILLRAVAGLDAETRIHGSGKDEAALRRQCERLRIARRVRFIGECPQSEVADRMRECSVIVIPSRWEGFPYVVLDAFAAGVPVIASRVGGIPDLIQDGVNGVLAPADNAPALTDAIATLLRNPRQRHAIALAAQESLPLHTLDHMVDNIERVYRDILKDPCPDCDHSKLKTGNFSL